MNWSGQQKGEGFEYHLLLIGTAVGFVINGAGAFSVDRSIGNVQLKEHRKVVMQ
jgi:putative oxidoreductase